MPLTCAGGLFSHVLALRGQRALRAGGTQPKGTQFLGSGKEPSSLCLQTPILSARYSVGLGLTQP